MHIYSDQTKHNISKLIVSISPVIDSCIFIAVALGVMNACRINLKIRIRPAKCEVFSSIYSHKIGTDATASTSMELLMSDQMIGTE